jgi:N-acetyl-anhydromuramyl-L-alanine amidase AmpD
MRIKPPGPGIPPRTLVDRIRKEKKVLYPKAVSKLLPIGVNHNNGGNIPRILVVHIMVGFMAGTDTIFRNPHTEASAHFGVSRTGKVWQWVRTGDIAWHAFDANSYSIGVEHEGFPTQRLTDRQIEATGELYAWLNDQYPAIDLWVNKNIGGSGIAYHEQYHAWNLDEHSCPGKLIEAQIHDILSVAKAHRA